MFQNLKSFIIGSSYPVIYLFVMSVLALENTQNYSVQQYFSLAPLWLGLMNIMAGKLRKKYNLSLRQSYLIFGLVSPLIVILFAMGTNAYDYSSQEWSEYSIYLITKHFLIFNIIIYFLEKNI